MSNNMDNVKETTKLNPATHAAVKRGLKVDNGWLNCCIFGKPTIISLENTILRALFTEEQH